jgi:hypothetical protein
LSTSNRETNMKTNEIRNYLLNDRSAMDNKGIKLEYLEAATSDKKWDEFLLTNKYDDLLAAVKANPYERAHQAFRRENASMIIKSTDKIAMTITFLDGETKKADSFINFEKIVEAFNSSYNKRKRKFINTYLAKFKKKQISNYQIACNKLGDFLK